MFAKRMDGTTGKHMQITAPALEVWKCKWRKLVSIRSILVVYLKMLFFHNCVMSTDGTSHEVEEKESLAFI